MRQGRRYGLSAEQKGNIWRRWKAGESLQRMQPCDLCHSFVFQDSIDLAVEVINGQLPC